MIYHQMLGNPAAALWHPHSTWIFPGYPPSPVFGFLRERAVLYVQDLFLITRKSDLNPAARFYMAPSFQRAISGLRFFFTNSATTQRELSPHVRHDAIIQPYRPRVENVFGLSATRHDRTGDRLIIGALGTIEPRKNFTAGAAICEFLAKMLGRSVEYHLIGRPGWGGDVERLSKMPHVNLHGFLPEHQARQIMATFDLFLCTSHEEGLGLPLLEVQYAGIPVVAPDGDVFREVLGDSGIFIRPGEPERAAATIAAALMRPDWHSLAAERARANIDRWNAQADSDRSNVVAALLSMKDGLLRCR